MSNEEQRHHAGRILEIAKDAVTTVRGAQHGSLNESFDMIAEMWSVYINHAVAQSTGLMPSPRISLSGADVLRMMGQMKQARSVWGDPLNVDNYVDEAGYSSLTAAYLGVVTPPAAGQPEQSKKKAKAAAEPIPSFLISDTPPEDLRHIPDGELLPDDCVVMPPNDATLPLGYKWYGWGERDGMRRYVIVPVAEAL